MSGGAEERGDVGAGKIGFSFVQRYKAISQLYAAIADRFYFPALQCHPGFKLLFQVVVVSRAFVECDGVRRVAFFGTFAHSV